MIQAYRRHSHLTAEQIGAMLDQETWMSAQQALDNGFIDAIIDSEGEQLPIAACADLTRYKNVPPAIAARLTRKVDPVPSPYVSLFQRSVEELDASMERLRLQHRLQRMRE